MRSEVRPKCLKQSYLCEGMIATAPSEVKRHCAALISGSDLCLEFMH